jgi:hypothetical protein
LVVIKTLSRYFGNVGGGVDNRRDLEMADLTAYFSLRWRLRII